MKKQLSSVLNIKNKLPELCLYTNVGTGICTLLLTSLIKNNHPFINRMIPK